MNNATKSPKAILEGYFIYNDENGWYLKFQDQSPLGPFDSFFDVEKQAKVYLALVSELKDIA
ncbi:hypothetical protein [Pleionea sediminis]|uniref:hypothetical protein n=1 Tax=Pleionea sediminis TaxID=2569479 RepID=UPI0011863B99|nr:hypothetical protein [Pleionea sediminis]